MGAAGSTPPSVCSVTRSSLPSRPTYRGGRRPAGPPLASPLTSPSSSARARMSTRSRNPYRRRMVGSRTRSTGRARERHGSSARALSTFGNLRAGEITGDVTCGFVQAVGRVCDRLS